MAEPILTKFDGHNHKRKPRRSAMSEMTFLTSMIVAAIFYFLCNLTAAKQILIKVDGLDYQIRKPLMSQITRL